MGVIRVILIVAFIIDSFIFYVNFNKDEHSDLIATLDTLNSTECPIGISLYRFKTDTYVYRIQIQKKLPHDLIQKTAILKRCEKEKLKKTPDESENELLDSQNGDIAEYENVLRATRELDRICEKAQGELEEVRLSKYLSNILSSNAVMAYLLELVKWPDTVDITDTQFESDTWSIQTLSRGIFPGTLWCGFGNVADDMFGQLGEHAQTDNCCRSHDLCRPIIKAFQTRFYYSNPSFLPISHCGCDLDFYRCLLKVNTPSSRSIGNIFFNLVKMKCFDFDIRDVCVSSFLGLCTLKEKKCVAVLKSNKHFPT